MKLSPLLVVLAVALMAGTVEAASVFLTGGVGSSSCGTWTAVRRERADGRAWGYEQWFLGFLSGVAYAGADREFSPLKGVDLPGVWAWVDNYCQAHPLTAITGAATAFVAEHPR